MYLNHIAVTNLTITLLLELNKFLNDLHTGQMPFHSHLHNNHNASPDTHEIQHSDTRGEALHPEQSCADCTEEQIV